MKRIYSANSKIICFASQIVTSAKEVIFSPGTMCLPVSLFVNKITEKLLDGF